MLKTLVLFATAGVMMHTAAHAFDGVTVAGINLSNVSYEAAEASKTIETLNDQQPSAERHIYY